MDQKPNPLLNALFSGARILSELILTDDQATSKGAQRPPPFRTPRSSCCSARRGMSGVPRSNRGR